MGWARAEMERGTERIKAYPRPIRRSCASRFYALAEGRMKFIYADSLDFVDPNYDFITDRSPNTREQYWDDLYPHEILGYSPYDGLLVSHAIVTDGKYSLAQAMRFRL